MAVDFRAINRQKVLHLGGEASTALDRQAHNVHGEVFVRGHLDAHAAVATVAVVGGEIGRVNVAALHARQSVRTLGLADVEIRQLKSACSL